jgi:hypothetical protein
LVAARSELAPAAESLDEAAKEYGLALSALEANELEKGAEALKRAAALDLKAGELMLRLSADGG